MSSPQARVPDASSNESERADASSLTVRLSTRLLGVPPAALDDGIAAGLVEVGRACGAAVVSLVEVNPSRGELRVLYHHGSAAERAVIGSSRALPWFAERLARGESLRFARLPDDLPAEAVAEREAVRHDGVRSVLIEPACVAASQHYALALGSGAGPRSWSETHAREVRALCAIFAGAFERLRYERELLAMHAENRELQRLLDAKPGEPAEDAPDEADAEPDDLGEIVGHSRVLHDVLERVRQVAPTDASVLLLGETGTGKELLARAIHHRSRRRHRRLVKVNCAALPGSLIESELFGHEKGAFTGALARKIGRFELADGGTLFLDEIGDLPVDLQSKLLRVLQDGEFERLGSSHTLRADVRVVAATNRDLQGAISSGAFREDLFYRLGVFPIRLPPLRERREDVPYLVAYLLMQKRQRLGKHINSVPDSVMSKLRRYAWPGNVRELENVVERAMILSPGPALEIHDSLIESEEAQSRAPDGVTLEEAERAHIVETLRRCHWRIKGLGNAADRLGLPPSTLRFRMRRLGIQRPSSGPRQSEMPAAPSR